MDDRQENHAAKGANERKPHQAAEWNRHAMETQLYVLLMPRQVVLRRINRKGYIS